MQKRVQKAAWLRRALVRKGTEEETNHELQKRHQPKHYCPSSIFRYGSSGKKWARM